MGELVVGVSDQFKIEIVCKYESAKITSETACKLLQISPRTLRRYVARYKAEGLGFFRHRNRRKRPWNKKPDEIKLAVQKIMKDVLFDFNISHAREKIRDNYGITIAPETMRRWCHEIGMVKHKKNVAVSSATAGIGKRKKAYSSSSMVVIINGSVMSLRVYLLLSTMQRQKLFMQNFVLGKQCLIACVYYEEL